MVEVLLAMPAIGPAATRMGVASGGHEMNSQNIILGGIAADRLQSNKAVSSLAKDLRTYQQEFDPIDFSVISQVKLKVGKNYLVRNMLTGHEEAVDTLLSEEGIPAETFIWEGDAGGLVYSELLDKYHQVASSITDVTALWVSYLPENSKNSGKNNRIYKLEKRGSDVTLTSYTAGGTEENMWDFMDSISGVKNDRNQSLHAQTAFFSPWEDDVSHKKVYETLFDSLSPGEKVKSAKYLDRFREDLNISDEERNTRNEVRDKMYAEMIREKMLKDNDVKTAFALVAQAVAYSVESNYQRVEVERRNSVIPAVPLIERVQGEKREKVEEKKDGSENKKQHKNVHKNTKVEEKPVEKVEEVISKEVFEPIVPILQAILAEFVMEDIEHISKVPEAVDGWRVEIRQLADRRAPAPRASQRRVEGEDVGRERNETVPVLVSEQIAIQGLILLMLAPSQDQEVEESKRYTGTQELLEIILAHSEGTEIKVEIEQEVKTIADEVIEFFTHVDKVEEEPNTIETLPSIKLLLEIYKDNETPQDLKELVLFFLFHEIKKVYEDKELRDKYTELAKIFVRFEVLLHDPVFLKRYEEFVILIENFFSTELLKDDGWKDFHIIDLLEFIKNGQYTIERLPDIGRLRWINMRPKKKKGTFPKKGIIYQYEL